MNELTVLRVVPENLAYRAGIGVIKLGRTDYASSAPASNSGNQHNCNNSDPFGHDESLRAIIDRAPDDAARLPILQHGQQATLNITWAVSVVGRERFKPTPLGRRLSLRQDDELRAQGVDWGLSQEIADWLRDDEETLVLPASHF
ncbi:hypothetical protein E8E11_005034 [Didymella keratinophila]|nr:hypothetical protein E8E11_005034 [Didymella keratinophila]